MASIRGIEFNCNLELRFWCDGCVRCSTVVLNAPTELSGGRSEYLVSFSTTGVMTPIQGLVI